MGRRATSISSVLGLVVFIASLTGARAATSQERDIAARVNAERSSRGLAALAWPDDLADIARAWSQHMASDGRISHDPSLPYEVSGWTALGDNVGRGATASAVQNGFMQSPDHRANIISPDYREIGVGIAQVGNLVYVTEIFATRDVSLPAPRARHGMTHNARTRPSTKVVPSALAATGRVMESEAPASSLAVDLLVVLVGLDARSVDPMGIALA